MKTHFSMDAHARYLMAPGAVAYGIAALILLALAVIPSLLSIYAFLLLLAALAAGLLTEGVVWYLHGIRSVEIDDGLLTIYRGPALAARRIRREAVARIQAGARLGKSVLALRLSTGERIRITEDAFPQEAFRHLVTVLQRWR